MIVAFSLTSCEQRTITRIPNDGVILAFGDSLTVGVGTPPTTDYPTVLAKLSGRMVINSGVSGEVTAQGLFRLPEVIEQTDPQLIILLEGGNDILRNKDHRQIKQNLAAMIEYAQQNHIDVVLVGVPAKNILFSVAPFYNELAEEYSLVYAEDLLSNLLRNPRYKSDAIHLNQQGYGILAESIHELLISRGALQRNTTVSE
ncbi:MAG: arylesterase [Desulfuromonadales bacterium C00003068]|nr:MAG: arylesterase [Desulfuromonadales bacterium C00003068]